VHFQVPSAQSPAQAIELPSTTEKDLVLELSPLSRIDTPDIAENCSVSITQLPPVVAHAPLPAVKARTRVTVTQSQNSTSSIDLKFLDYILTKAKLLLELYALPSYLEPDVQTLDQCPNIWPKLFESLAYNLAALDLPVYSFTFPQEYEPLLLPGLTDLPRELDLIHKLVVNQLRSVLSPPF